MATLERKPTVGSWVLLEMWSPSLERTFSYTQYVFKKKKIQNKSNKTQTQRTTVFSPLALAKSMPSKMAAVVHGNMASEQERMICPNGTGCS